MRSTPGAGGRADTYTGSHLVREVLEGGEGCGSHALLAAVVGWRWDAGGGYSGDRHYSGSTGLHWRVSQHLGSEPGGTQGAVAAPGLKSQAKIWLCCVDRKCWIGGASLGCPHELSLLT